MAALHTASSSCRGMSSMSCSRESTFSKAPSSLLSIGSSTCRSAQSLKIPHWMLSSTRVFSPCLLSFLLASSAWALSRCTSARLALPSRSSLSRAEVSCCRRDRPSAQRSESWRSRSSSSACRALVASTSRSYWAQSRRRASSLELLFSRCSMLRSSVARVRKKSSYCSTSCRRCRRSRCSCRMASRTSLTPSSWLSCAKNFFPTLRSSTSWASFFFSSSAVFAAPFSTLDLSSSMRLARPSVSFISEAWAASMA
mmetsp:Transcript_14080/g.41914  ORF Transcript_14080/g.41914 Transcript_14080/m.41914 type:complete len:255 (+) Transcript_14080:793-1557(+)